MVKVPLVLLSILLRQTITIERPVGQIVYPLKLNVSRIPTSIHLVGRNAIVLDVQETLILHGIRKDLLGFLLLFWLSIQ